MKKLIQVGTMLCSLLFIQTGYADEGSRQMSRQDMNSRTQKDAYSQKDGQAGVYYHDSYGRENKSQGYNDQNYSQGYQGSTDQSGYSYGDQSGYSSAGQSGYSSAGQTGYSCAGGACGSGSLEGQPVPADECCQPADKACGDCWCLYAHYEPCYYNTWRCVEEPKYYTKKCCRYVPKYYEVQKCRYVPEYYCETQCCQVPEYYDVQECTTCKKWVCDRHCKYVPKYYYKHVCENPTCDSACPSK